MTVNPWLFMRFEFGAFVPKICFVFFRTQISQNSQNITELQQAWIKKQTELISLQAKVGEKQEEVSYGRRRTGTKISLKCSTSVCAFYGKAYVCICVCRNIGMDIHLHLYKYVYVGE